VRGGGEKISLAARQKPNYFLSPSNLGDQLSIESLFPARKTKKTKAASPIFDEWGSLKGGAFVFFVFSSRRRITS
jgi:hypothetical protein